MVRLTDQLPLALTDVMLLVQVTPDELFVVLMVG